MFTEGTGISQGAAGRDNEDDWLVDDDIGLYVVCDGMGGHRAGARAAQLAIDAVGGSVEAQRSWIAAATNEAELEQILAEALRFASRCVWDAASEDPYLSGMGCSCTALLVRGDLAASAHVGHTRMYLVRGEALHQLTRDHTMAAEVRAHRGELPITPMLEKAVTRALGLRPDVRVETSPVFLESGDRLVLCSDGAWVGPDGAPRLERELRARPALAVGHALIEGAGGSAAPDDVTVVAVRVLGDPERPQPHELAKRALSHLGGLQVFESLGLRQRSRVMGLAELDTVDAGTELVRAGAQLDEVLLVVDGSLALDGAEGPARVSEGDAVGWSRLVGAAPARATARARGRTTVLRIDAAGFRRLAWRRPWLAVPPILRVAQELRAGEVDPL